MFFYIVLARLDLALSDRRRPHEPGRVGTVSKVSNYNCQSDFSLGSESDFTLSVFGFEHVLIRVHKHFRVRSNSQGLTSPRLTCKALMSQAQSGL